MADSNAAPRKEEELRDVEDPMGAAAMTTKKNDTVDDEVIDDEKRHMRGERRGSLSIQIGSEDDDDDEKLAVEKDKERLAMERSKSYATTASVRSDPMDRLAVHTKKWYKTPNPLRWGSPPPVPSERQVSREYKASFLSKLYFQWVSPIMSVSDLLPRICSIH
jgi:hypothetical protein